MDNNEFDRTAEEFREFSAKMRDPVVVGSLMHALSQERESSNLLLKDIQNRLQAIEEKLARIEAAMPAKPAARPKSVSDVDDRLLDFVKSHGAADAAMVQVEFGYKGRNAASSRLNALWKQGLLQKRQKGKTVLFEPSLESR